jgi:uncharacterized protein with ATP-grasp and redox domains
MIAPQLQVPLQKKLVELSGVKDLYRTEKCKSNNLALSLVQYWRDAVASSRDPFSMAARLAIAGNIMDYGANDTFDLRKTIERVFQVKLAIDHTEKLRAAVARAKRILYLGDNAGEIVFDKLFIEIIGLSNVTFVTRGGSTINDATLKDANDVRMQEVATVISNGLAAPSTLLSHSSEDFLEIYRNADLIISKGQGNLEGLIDENDPRIFFILMAKCDVIAERLNVKKGDFMITRVAQPMPEISFFDAEPR